jgi:hypothetical protein
MNCWVGHNNLGLSFFGKRQLNAAIAQYQKALEINPNYAPSFGSRLTKPLCFSL